MQLKCSGESGANCYQVSHVVEASNYLVNAPIYWFVPVWPETLAMFSYSHLPRGHILPYVATTGTIESSVIFVLPYLCAWPHTFTLNSVILLLCPALVQWLMLANLHWCCPCNIRLITNCCSYLLYNSRDCIVFYRCYFCDCVSSWNNRSSIILFLVRHDCCRYCWLQFKQRK